VRRGLLALVAAVGLLLTVGAVEAAAAIDLRPSTRGARDRDGGRQLARPFRLQQQRNQNDGVVAACPTQGIATAQSCFFGNICFPVASTLVLAATPAPSRAGHWSFVGWENCPTASGAEYHIANPPIFAFVAVTPWAVFNDSVWPTVTGITLIHSTSVDRGISFGSATANETLSSVSCTVDGGAFAPCSTVRAVAEGTHTVRAQGVDQSGNTGAVGGTLTTFNTVDTQLVSGPADFSTVKRPTFTYSSLENNRFECSIDNVVISTPCGDKDINTSRASFTPLADLAEGCTPSGSRPSTGRTSIGCPSFARGPWTPSRRPSTRSTRRGSRTAS
jgi:hypothetical protein